MDEQLKFDFHYEPVKEPQAKPQQSDIIETGHQYVVDCHYYFGSGTCYLHGDLDCDDCDDCKSINEVNDNDEKID